MPKLQYDFSVIGLPAVHNALASLEKRLAQHNAKVNRIVGGGGGGKGKRPPIPSRGDKKQKKSLTRLDRTAKRMHSKRMSELSAVEQQQIKTAHKVHKIKRKNQLRRARANKREKIRSLREIDRIENQAQLKKTREATKARRKHQRTLERTRANRLATGRRVVGGGVRGVGRSLRGVGRAGLMYGGMVAGAAGGAALSYEMNVDERVRLLAMATHGAQEGRKRTIGLRPGETLLSAPERGAAIKSSAQGTAQRTGVSTEKILQGLAKWQEITGRGDLSDKIAPMIGDFSQVFGADPKAVAGTAAYIYDRVRKEMNAEGTDRIHPEEALKKTMNIMNSAGAQGQLGMIEFGSLAPVMSKLVSATMNVTGDIEEVIKQYIALAQLSVSGGARDAFEATTALMRFTDNVGLLAKKKEFKDMNRRLAARGQPIVDPYTYSEDKHGKVRHGVTDPVAVLKELYRGTGGDIVALQSMLSIRGKKVSEPVMALIKKYSGGKSDKKSLNEGFKKMHADLKMFTEAGTNKEAWEKMKQYARGSSKAVAGRAWESIASKLGPEVVKVLEALVPAAGDIGDAFVILAKGLAGFIKAMHDHPWSMIGAMLGAILVKEIMAAGIGHMVGKAVAAGVGSSAFQAVMGTAMGKALMAASAAAAWMWASYEIEQLEKEKKAAKTDLEQNRENLLGAEERLRSRGGKLRGLDTVEREKEGFWARVIRGDSWEDASRGKELLSRDQKTGKVVATSFGAKSLWAEIFDALSVGAGLGLGAPTPPVGEQSGGPGVATAQPISALAKLDTGDLSTELGKNTIAVGNLANKVGRITVNRSNGPAGGKDE